MHFRCSVGFLLVGCLHNVENNIEISFDALMGSVFCKFVVLMTSVIFVSIFDALMTSTFDVLMGCEVWTIFFDALMTSAFDVMMTSKNSFVVLMV